MLIMAAVTYLIRALPLTLIRREIKNVYIRSFLHYVPYVTLAVMTFPAILFATQSTWSALAGFVVAMMLGYMRKGLFTIASAACLTVLLTELLIIPLR